MLSSQVHEVKEPEYQSGENNRGLCDGTITEVDIRKTVAKNRKGKTTSRNAELEKERERERRLILLLSHRTLYKWASFRCFSRRTYAVLDYTVFSLIRHSSASSYADCPGSLPSKRRARGNVLKFNYRTRSGERVL